VQQPRTGSRVWTACSLAVLATLGCGGDGVRMVPVSGTVTFDGGPCPAPGRVTFSPVETAEGAPSRPAFGAFEEDGAYKVMSFRPGDGLFPGRYVVNVSCVDASKISNPPSDESYRRASYVAEGFEPKELVVEPRGGAVVFDFDVPRRE